MEKQIAHSTVNSASRLDAVMTEQGRRSDWLAAQVGVSYAMVAHWRAGRRRITEAHIEKVARALGVTEGSLR